MKPKIPWLPPEVQRGQPAEMCPRCGANKLMPWTLRRDPKRVTLLRTWVCTACQTTEERRGAGVSPCPLPSGERESASGVHEVDQGPQPGEARSG